MDIKKKRSLLRYTVPIFIATTHFASAQITNPAITNDQQNIYFSFLESSANNYYEVFIDSDMQASTGYSMGGIGADRLLENGAAYKSTANGKTWAWSEIQPVTFTNANGQVKWSMPLSILGATSQCGTPINVIFSANNGDGTSDVTAVMNYQLNIGSSCISSQSSNSNNSQFIFQYTAVGQNFYRVYIDSDENAKTGYQQGNIGADYLLEGNNLYSYVGPNWNWKFIKTVSFTEANNIQQWALNRSDINANCTGGLNYLYQTQNGNNLISATRGTINYANNTSCGNYTAQAIAVPSYFYPSCNGSTCYWNQLDQSIPPVNIALINPNSGPGSAYDANYAAQATLTHSLGSNVLGYVYTNYGARSIAAVESDIDKYYSWYSLDGIFFDEGYASDCSQVAYYQTLNNYVKAKTGKGLTVVNFGTNTPECYTPATDILLTFESDQNAYANYQVDSWTANYPAERFWHIVYGTTQTALPSTMSLTQQRHAGYVYVTPNTGANPYSSLPNMTYWSMEEATVR